MIELVTQNLHRNFQFLKLQDMVQGLVNQLLEEAAKQATQKGFCESAMGKATKERDRRLREAKKLNLGHFLLAICRWITKPKVKHTHKFPSLERVFFLVEIQISTRNSLSVDELFTLDLVCWLALSSFLCFQGAPRWDPWTAREVSSWKRTNC